MKTRLDVYLHELGCYESRKLARAAVLEGLVLVNGRAAKPGTPLKGDEEIDIGIGSAGYVSRGGRKLEHAIDALDINVEGKIALDVGASTGGFTDCLLGRGAVRVIAVDVGKGQLHWKLRQDPRVDTIEGLNARRLKREDLPAVPSVATIDVSFISLKKVLEPVFGVLAEEGDVVALIKPQFEAGRRHVQKGGVVRDAGVHADVLNDMRCWLEGRGLCVRGLVASPLPGPKGNIEYFFHIRRGEDSRLDSEQIEKEVRKAHDPASGRNTGVDDGD